MSIKNFSQDNVVYVLCFSSQKCAPCRSFEPIFGEVTNIIQTTNVLKNITYEFKKINIEENQDLSEYFSIQCIPTVVLFFQQKQIGKKSGAMSTSDFSNFIKNSINQNNIC
jgi:thioredoxin-like negative regulator of GroEL